MWSKKLISLSAVIEISIQYTVGKNTGSSSVKSEIRESGGMPHSRETTALRIDTLAASQTVH